MRHVKKRSRRRGTIAKVAELAIAAPQVVAIRTARMLAAGPNPSAVDRAEFSKMSTEKVQAFWESMFGMGAQILKTNQEYARTSAVQCWRLWTTPWRQGMMSLTRAAARIHGVTASQRRRAMSAFVEAGLAPVHKRATQNARRLGRINKKR